MTSAAFAAGMAALGCTDLETLRYVGGDYSEHARYFDIACPGMDRPPHASACVCRVRIKNNAYLRQGADGPLFVVGSCCVKKFVARSGRTCEDCGEPHRNRKVNLCTACRNGLPLEKPCIECPTTIMRHDEAGQACGRCVSCRTCEDCGALHQNRETNHCTDCRNGTPLAKKCSECPNTIMRHDGAGQSCGRCVGCRVGICWSCLTPVARKFDRCFRCKYPNVCACGKRCGAGYVTCFGCSHPFG